MYFMMMLFGWIMLFVLRLLVNDFLLFIGVFFFYAIVVLTVLY